MSSTCAHKSVPLWTMMKCHRRVSARSPQHHDARRRRGGVEGYPNVHAKQQFEGIFPQRPESVPRPGPESLPRGGGPPPETRGGTAASRKLFPVVPGVPAQGPTHWRAHPAPIHFSFIYIVRYHKQLSHRVHTSNCTEKAESG